MGKSPVTDEFPAQKASNAESVSIWWPHHVILSHTQMGLWVRIHVGIEADPC